MNQSNAELEERVILLEALLAKKDARIAKLRSTLKLYARYRFLARPAELALQADDEAAK